MDEVTVIKSWVIVVRSVCKECTLNDNRCEGQKTCVLDKNIYLNTDCDKFSMMYIDICYLCTNGEYPKVSQDPTVKIYFISIQL